jgi:hypothetical protein
MQEEGLLRIAFGGFLRSLIRNGEIPALFEPRQYEIRVGQS